MNIHRILLSTLYTCILYAQINEEIIVKAALVNRAITRAGGLPDLNLDSGLIAMNGTTEFDVNGNLVTTGTTTLSSDVSVLGNLCIGALVATNQACDLLVNGCTQITGNETIGGSLTVTTTVTTASLIVTGSTSFNGPITFPGKNTTLNAVGSYPDSALRIVAGSINSSGPVILSGGGFTITKNTGVGSVTITFTKPFTSTPILTATNYNSLNAVYISAASASSVTINRTKDGIFNFIAIGQ